MLQHMAGDPSLTFAIDVGDMVERGTLEQFDEFFKQIQPYGRMPFLTAVGNHDLGKNQDLTLYREIFGPDYYAFQLQGQLFYRASMIRSLTGSARSSGAGWRRN